MNTCKKTGGVGGYTPYPLSKVEVARRRAIAMHYAKMDSSHSVTTTAPMTNTLPSVVIVGRPNVGKSTLFNRLTGTRRSIVTDEPGITRDRIYGRCVWNNRPFEVVDTGGMILEENAEIPREIVRQADVA